MNDVRITYAGNNRKIATNQILTIGRSRDNDLMVTDAGASRRHAQLRRVGDQIEVVDLGSSNGTFVDGRRITAPTLVAPGGSIQLGGTDASPLGVEVRQPTGGAQLPPQSGPSGGAALPHAGRPTGPAGAGPSSGHGHQSGPLPKRLPATSSVPKVPSHTGVVFDRYELQNAMQAAPVSPSGHTSVQGAAPQVLASAGGPGGGPTPGTMTIGRGLENQVIIDDLLASRQHARLVPNGHGFDVQDLGSRNGTYINGQRIDRGRLGEGDLLAVGHSRFTVLRGQLVASIDEGDVNFVANHLTFELSGGKKLLDDISFALEGSSLLAVIGPSGAGKSTLLKALTGSQRATRGEVYYDGRDLYQNFDDLRHRIGVVPQDDVVHRQLTVKQALRFAAELRFPDDLDKHLRDQRVDEVMAELDLTAHAGTRVDKLSGGQRKRTSVALELLTRPSLLFLDEPTSGLDPGLDKQVMHTLRELADGGRTVVVITHSVANLNVCDKVLLLAPGGKVAYFGPPDQLLPFFGLSDHADVFTSVARDPEGSKQRFKASPLEAQQIEAPLSAPRPPVPPLEKPPRQQSIPSQLSTLARRHLQVIFADRGYSAFMLLLPVALAALAVVVPGENGLAKPAPGEPFKLSEPLTLLVVIIVGALFMGTAASIRELVGERAIFTREKAVGLSPSAYLWGKLTIFGLLTLVQSTILVLLITLAKKPPSGAVMLGSATLELILVCWFTAFCAVSLGLLMSSFVNTSEQVMPLLVVSIMAQLVLCGGLFEVYGRPGLEQLSWLTPGRWGYAAAVSTTDVVGMLPPGQAFDAARATVDDPLWQHSPGKWMLSMIMLLVLAALFAVLTKWRLARKTND
ncbi:FHA domain-containing protein [Yimella sp. cx-51]|uniref:FHA domain-containing protein n=1 Tax=Yimella sp. cx-51 TaxID=2770551 RepID=UPI00165E555D|nr:FHA domain-containing protein [Yimella sp. cx-51]MBC9956112.1 FHA domain-containing protein [Yimella sp. cx-51]MBD2758278.1 FHA domain-containing protein [Yimella sp. cx-573]QTH37358.1 FHA domain-containing protein [Yimella sp. cx-51]